MAHCLNWDSWDLGIAMISWREGHAPSPPRGTLSPLVPLSLRALKVEGERRTEAYACATHMRMPLVQYWGEGERAVG